MNMALLRRRFSLGLGAALLGAALVLSACGGDEPEPVAPAVEEPAAEEAVEEEVDQAQEAAEEAGGEDVSTETEVITETGIVTEEIVTVTEVLTETDVVTDVEVIPAEEITDETEGVTETGEMTGTEGMTETGAAAPAAGAAAAMAGAGVSGAEDALVRASVLVDYDFENADGQVSGEIEDLMIDLSSGNILYVTVEYGGVLELGDTQLALPLSAFMIGPEGELVLNFDEATLENFPDLGAEWPDTTNVAWDDELNAFWSEQGIETAGNFEAPTGAVAWASDLIGLGTADLGAGAGSVQDIIIDLGTGQAKYALVGFGAGVDEGPVAVPFSAFNVTEVGNELVWNEDFDAAWLEEAPRLDLTTYGPDQPLDPAWDDDFDAFWSERGYDIDAGE